MSEVGSLADAAAKRKERLLALKNRATRSDSNEPPGKKLAEGETLPNCTKYKKDDLQKAIDEVRDGKSLRKAGQDNNVAVTTVIRPIFRSYKPTDDSLKDSILPKAKPVDVVDIVKDQLEASKPEPMADEIDLTTLAPRKPDWDLKRDVSKKLEKLDRRTQRAIAELIRERLELGKEDLVTAVNTAGHLQEDED